MTEAMMPVTVEQCDRDAAGTAWLKAFGKSHVEDRIEAVISGDDDGHPLVQAFACHRLNTRATPPSPAGLVEEFIEWINACWPHETGSAFNQGVIRGFEIIKAQVENGHTPLTANGSQTDRVVDVLREAEALNEIDLMMSEFVDNWPKPKRFDTALKLVAKTLRILMHPPKHQWWGAGETDCPDDIKAGNGEIHTLRCKVCGETSPRDSRCLSTLDAKDQSND